MAWSHDRVVPVELGARPDVTSDVVEENWRLRRENAELKRANEILKADVTAVPVGRSSTGLGLVVPGSANDQPRR